MNFLWVLAVSAAPILELRAGIPLAIYLGFNPVEAYLLSVIGNFLPVPFLLITLEKLLGVVSKFDFIWNFYKKIEFRVKRKKELIEKYGYIGLILFVSVPLPVTGAWTACLLAFLLNMNKLKSCLAITVGICIAGILVISPIIGLFNFIK
ncbi:MAG: small multi-drug export protein [Archaeoglobaceae archaeon]|nr:small multi-drug export protein [Archaeoglobaceae archaeon]